MSTLEENNTSIPQNAPSSQETHEVNELDNVDAVHNADATDNADTPKKAGMLKRLKREKKPKKEKNIPNTGKAKDKTRPLDIVKVVAWCIIALALVKLAFFPAGVKDTAQSPSADFAQNTVAVERGSITSSVSANGTITQDGAGALKAPLEGTIISIAVGEGQEVGAGARIAQIQQAIPGEDSYSFDAEGNQIVTPGRTNYRSQWVTAPVAGTVHITAVLNQNVNAGDSIGSVQPKTHAVVAQLTADQMYRLVTAPETARVSVKNGPQPFDCTGLKITTNSGSATDEGVTATNIEARCPIPADIRVFPGQSATLTINAGEAKDVLVVPTTAVEGRYQKGFVYTPDGKQKEVEIGLTDGNKIEIRSGLKEGEEILEYVPGGENAAMECDPMTGEGC